MTGDTTGDDDVMTWTHVEWGPWPASAVLPRIPPSDTERGENDLPSTLTVVRGTGIVQRPVFDPALMKYSKAMRAGEPQFTSPSLAARWHEARHRALDDVISAIAGSRWAANLVLRGSVLLKAWYGDAAREPGDLDFVVAPETWHMGEPRTARMLDEVAAAAAAVALEHGAVRIDASNARSDEIWTYSRVPGIRLVLPWHAEGLPTGTIQLDFVFNERLPADAESTPIPARGTDDVHRVLAATPELSLAWKLLWLLSDKYPQGKDLYDAVLLAEATPLPLELLMRTLVAAGPEWAGRRFGPQMLEDLAFDEDELNKDYPELPDTVEGLRQRLTAALAPTFAESAAIPPADGYTWRARHLALRIARARELLRDEGLEAVLTFLDDERTDMAEGIVVLRETIGADRCGLADAAATLTDLRLRPYHSASSYRPNIARFAEEAVIALGESV
ncbi:nucleotidyl transferase AbiEii/AbiGii toxin family protein [Embleya sp. NBC_00896]|uniref:nucleotidyl transferase AbiEii/AbiGii toxin family protein n=1 Tax=Embleya sp. NBC_00896 TaxID=2975961 RepID=UPI002F915AE3|nr:nucleotidyl transferase AbiEii/AbiGii toxin family protein [Embleya sp. NBC_00896]